MNFTIDPIPFWSSGAVVTTIVFAVIILALVALFILSLLLDWWDIDVLFLGLAVIFTAVGLVVVPLGGSIEVSNRLRHELTSGISDLGFKNVKLDSDWEGFTASQEGKYVQGVVRETENDKYEVLLLETAK